MSLMTCIQPNGERLPVERWVYYGFMNGTVVDPLLVMVVKNAVEIRDGFGWPR